MAGSPDATARSPAVQRALSVVNLGAQAATAYNRPDLGERLALGRTRLLDPAFHVFVVGEFKQGKSSLVNALLNAPVCPVDDDIATAVPTAVGYGERPTASVVLKRTDGGDAEPVRQDIPVEQVASYVTEAGIPPADQLRTSSSGGVAGGAGSGPGSGRSPQVQLVEVTLPRKLLTDGLVVVDTPGVGGLGSAHSAATIGALPMADAVIFVTDASQELTGPEIEFLQTALRMCPNVACVLTKVDFYPAWRRIRDLDVEHLDRHGIKAPLLCVSSALRIHALRTNDRTLNQESGFPELVHYLQQDIAGQAEKLTVRSAASDVLSVASLLTTQFETERQALDNPEGAKQVVENLTELKAKANRLRGSASKWQQSLTDGIIDLQADLDHDLRARLRQITTLADEAIDTSDPADTWDEFQTWLHRRVAEEIVNSYTFLHSRAEELGLRVAEHFGEDSDDMELDLERANPTEVMASVQTNTAIEAEKEGLGTQTLAGMRGSYSGIIMFGMVSGVVTGLGLFNPFAAVAGLFMGRRAVRDEKDRQLTMRRSQAKQAHRKYTDEVAFVVGKDSRDTLRRIQRHLRDFFAARAEELHRSTTEALDAAQQAVQSDQSTRQRRLRDVNAELERIAGLRKKALELSPELGVPA